MNDSVPIFQAGDDFKEDKDSLATYGIDINEHSNAIEVHGRPELRDRIIELLEADECARTLTLLDYTDLKPKCEHVWVDPSNERIEAGTWRLCTRCGVLRDLGADAGEDE